MELIGRKRRLTGSSVSVSVSPAHSTPGVVHIGLSRMRDDDDACVEEDASEKMRLRRLCALLDDGLARVYAWLLLLWTLLLLPLGIMLEEPRREVYIMEDSLSSSVSEFMCGCGIV